MQDAVWQEKIKRQLAVVSRWRASGQSIAAWAQAHGEDARLLMGWISYEGRWRARLAGSNAVLQSHASARPGPKKTVRGKPVAVASSLAAFVPVRGLASLPHSASVRIECDGAGVVLHWPVEHAVALASWLRVVKTTERGTGAG